MSLRIVHMSDLHVRSDARLPDQAATLRAVVDEAIGYHPDLWLITGDLYGRTVPHRSTPLERATLHPEVVRMAEVAPVVVIAGNHDDDEDILGLQHLRGNHPIHVITSAQRLTVETMGGPVALYCLPYPTKRSLVGDHPMSLSEAQQAIEERLAGLLGCWRHEIRKGRLECPEMPHVFLFHGVIAGTKMSGGEVMRDDEITLSRADVDALPFDYGAVGHPHLRQELAERCWAPSSLWRNDYSETDPKGWHLVDIAETLSELTADPFYEEGFTTYREEDDRQACTVRRMLSPCRTFHTIEVEWGDVGGLPGWITPPPDLSPCRDAEVRVRLQVGEAWVGSCPWGELLTAIRAAGAVRLAPERRVIPSQRVRAPAVAAAETSEAKMQAFWETLEPPPTGAEREAAIGALRELEGR